MKKIFNVMMLVIAMTMFTVNSFAQAPNNKQRLTREQLSEKQAKYIANDLALDNETTAKFINTYTQCQKEIWALGPRPRRNGNNNGRNGNNNGRNDNNNEEQIGQNIKKRFEMSEKILDIRQKYYKEYSKFLTQKQIQRVYEVEKNMMKRFAQHKRKGGQRGMRGQHGQRLVDKNSTK